MTACLGKLFGQDSKSARRSLREARKPARQEVEAPTGLSLVDDAPSKHRGFDPYNSGSFQRSNAWERVIRR